MDCRETQRFVQLRLDEEIEPVDCVQLDLHIEGCPACRKHVEHEAWFQAKLRASLRASMGATTACAPAALRDRIKRQLHTEAGPSIFPYGRAVAASFAAMILAGLSWGAASRPDQPHDETVARHSSNLPPEIRPMSGDGAEVHRFLERNLRYPVQVPSVAQADLPVRLVGARLSNIRDRDAAYVMYDHRGAKLSLFAYPSSNAPSELAGLEKRLVGGRELYVGSSRGYNVVSWKNRDLVYSLVSDVDTGELVRLAASMR